MSDFFSRQAASANSASQSPLAEGGTLVAIPDGGVFFECGIRMCLYLCAQCCVVFGANGCRATRRAAWIEITRLSTRAQPASDAALADLKGFNYTRSRHSALKRAKHPFSQIHGVCFHAQ